ncbi:zinc-finger domain-containing protein [Candidatus Mesenet endosymbiont of Agriotes lineatus]|uniref:zinc-finger domain-containing protein n=1 Tax=Candidatus Mesenet endosymbiont of Agriotes lineatus TaxID=3077948 RepID=UPI0030D0D917
MYQLKVKHKKICCNGTNEIGIDEGLGHPLIYLDMGNEDSIACPYCSKVFIYSYAEDGVLN